MRALSATELLDAWERGLPEDPPARAVTLLAAATGAGRAELARLTVGESDRRLLRLREQTFGPRLDALAACPRCGELLEMAFDVRDVLVEPEASGAPETHRLSVGGYEVDFRAPTSLDLLAVGTAADAEAARFELFRRCLVAATKDGAGVPAESLPGEVVGRVAEGMAEADPQADVEVALSCPACGHGWGAALDICSFFWAEINAWAARTLSEVHTLARAYGWTEREVLSLSAWRRQFYLRMVTG
jgi:hypothetical protein